MGSDCGFGGDVECKDLDKMDTLPFPILPSSWANAIRDATHYVGRMLEVTGATHYIHNELEKAYGNLTGNPCDSVVIPDTSLLKRKVQKLKLQGRPYEAKSDNMILDYLGVPTKLFYHSKGPVIKHNCKFSRKSGNATEKIQCRHLAYAYASGAIGRSPEKFQEVETEDRLLKSSGIPDDKALDGIFRHKRNFSHAVYFSLQTLPDALYYLAQETGDCQRANYLFDSTTHSMGLSLEKTQGKEITLYCYDPNDTGRHKKIIVRDADELKTLTIDDLVKDTHLYFPQGLESGCLLRVEANQKQQDCRVKCFSPLDVGTVRCMAYTGHYGATDIDGKSIRLADTKDKVLLAEKLTDGCPALYIAAHKGHTESIQALGEDIESSPLDNDSKKELLAGKGADGTPALYVAAQEGHTEIVQALAEIIESSHLDNESKKELIAGKRADGTPALYIAAQKGHTEIVQALAKMIKSSPLDNDSKKELLAGKRNNGTPALCIAVQSGNTETIQALTKAFKSSPLDNDSKKELLDGKRADGTSALDSAALLGHTKSFQALTEAIKSSPLDNKSKKELLAGKQAAGAPAA